MSQLEIKIDSNWEINSEKGTLKLYKFPKISEENIIANVELEKYNGTITYEVIAEIDNYKFIQIKSPNYGSPWIYLEKGTGEKNGKGYTFLRKAEFQNVIWMGPPKSYKEGRSYKILWNVIHCTEGSENNSAAENGSLYDQRRDDRASSHFYYDPDSSVQTLYTTNRAFAAYYIANERGVHHELCGLASQTRDEWLDKNSKSIIENAAKTCAYVCLKYNIPFNWLTKKEIKDRKKGFVTHADITEALEGNHLDPGKNFPKDYFIERVEYWIKKI